MKTNEVIVLVNFNTYLGGGETLLVRYASYLLSKNIDFLVFCCKDSYIERDLKKRGISDKYINSFNFNPNFYYLNKNKREILINHLYSCLDDQKINRFVTFMLRDLYTIYSLTSRLNCSITHLILHPEDDLYVGQTLVDKFNYKFFKNRNFNEKKAINTNHNLIRILNDKKGVISMTEIITKLWNSRIGISMDNKYIVPLPSFKPTELSYKTNNFEKKIIWIGRIVDFKIPSLIQMINFINESDYQLTIVGDGNLQVIYDHIDRNKINKSKIEFIGQVDYNELPIIIQKNSIGYAMGTSLIELAKFKMPVIVALASFDHKNFKSQICGGLFYDKYKGCDGTDLLFVKEEDINTTISDTVSYIEGNYEQSAENCYQYAKQDFSEEENFEKYTVIIQNTECLLKEDKTLLIPEASTLRKILFNSQSNE